MLHSIDTIEEFNEIIGSSGKIVVDFWADWCPPCKAIGPFYEKESEKFPGTKFCKFDVGREEGKIVSKRYNFNSIPRFILFQNGKDVSQYKEGEPKGLHDWLEEHA